MAWKVFDFKCINEKCELFDNKVEELQKNDEPVLCSKCSQPLEKLFSPTISPTHVSWSTWRI